MRIGKRYSFQAAHQLLNHKGKCKNLHGHSYEVEIEVTGPIHDDRGESNDGMVIDFDILDQAVNPVMEALDHKFLNDVEGIGVATAENVAGYIATWTAFNLEVFPQSDNVIVRLVRVWETRKSYAEWVLGQA